MATLSAVRSQMRTLTDEGFIFFLVSGELAFSTYQGSLTTEREQWIEDHRAQLVLLVREHGLPVPAGWTIAQEVG